MSKQELYFITKKGVFYRPNCRGYTTFPELAGLYDKDFALQYVIDTPCCEASPVSAHFSKVGFIDERIQGLKTVRNAIAGTDECQNDMTFSEALKLVKKGKKVTRVAWDDGDYLYLGQADGAYQTTQKPVSVLIVRHNGDDYYYAYDSDFDLSTDLLADDWMLYEETPNEH